MADRTAVITQYHGRWIVADADRAKIVATCPDRRLAYAAARAQGYRPLRIH